MLVCEENLVVLDLEVSRVLLDQKASEEREASEDLLVTLDLRVKGGYME